MIEITNTYVSGDTDGNGTADFAIKLADNVRNYKTLVLTPADLIL